MNRLLDRISQNPGLAIGGIFAGVGVVMLLVAGILTFNQIEPNDHITTTGVVVDHQVVKSNDRERSDTYYLVVEFEVDGETFTVRGNVSSVNPKPIGTEVPVSYPPGDPGSGYVDDAQERWFPPILMTAMGVFFGVIGLVFARPWRQRRR